MENLYEPLLIFVTIFPITSLFYREYDVNKITNIIVRFIHGIGCIYYSVPLIIKNNYQLSMITDKEDFDDCSYILSRSISYFLWDTLALIFEKEKEKMLFIGHHLLTIIGLYYGILCRWNSYNVVLGLLIGEITNPIHQIMDILKVINYRVIEIEIIYLISFYFARGYFGICAFKSLISDYNENLIIDECYFSYIISIIIYMIIIPLSFDWSYKKYISINKYLMKS